VRADLDDLAAAFKKRALGAAAVTGVLAISGLFVVKSDAPELYDGLTSGAALVAVIGSALAGVVTLWLIWTNRFEIARYTSGIAVGATLTASALAQRPDFLPGEVTLDQAAAGDSTLLATLIVLIVALAVIIPSMAALFRLSLDDRLKEPFHPITGTEK
jgi:cytochrome bd ubiquinol oxidase subunit II